MIIISKVIMQFKLLQIVRTAEVFTTCSVNEIENINDNDYILWCL